MKGIKQLRDGLTIETIQEKYAWLFDAKIEDAVIGETNGKLKWYEGTWFSGIWEDGIWEDGCWVGGTWVNGTWCGGTWISGVWENGTHTSDFWLSDKPTS